MKNGQKGAVDYVAQVHGRSELSENWDQFRWHGGENVTDQYIRDREAEAAAFWQGYH